VERRAATTRLRAAVSVVVGGEAPDWGQRLGTDLDAVLTQSHKRVATIQSDLATTQGDVAAIQTGVGNGFVPISGTLVWWSDTLPSGSYGTFAFANGQAVSRTTFAAAFAIFGTTYGAGDGSTTFNLPDLRDNVPVGKGTMGGTSAVNRIVSGVTGFTSSVLGAMYGAALHVLTLAQTPANTISGTTADMSADHTHTFSGATDGQSAPHTHPIHGTQVLAPLGSGGTVVQNTNSGGGNSLGDTNNSSNDHTHNFSGTTNGASGGHVHSFSASNGGGGGSHNSVQPSIVCNWIIRIA
jgi:microcystin-dependent protein